MIPFLVILYELYLCLVYVVLLISTVLAILVNDHGYDC